MIITIFTKSDCNFCASLKSYLAEKQLQYIEKKVEEGQHVIDELLEKSKGFAGVPFTIIESDTGEQSILKGFTKEEFDLALQSLHQPSQQQAVTSVQDQQQPSIPQPITTSDTTDQDLPSQQNTQTMSEDTKNISNDINQVQPQEITNDAHDNTDANAASLRDSNLNIQGDLPKEPIQNPINQDQQEPVQAPLQDEVSVEKAQDKLNTLIQNMKQSEAVSSTPPLQQPTEAQTQQPQPNTQESGGNQQEQTPQVKVQSTMGMDARTTEKKQEGNKPNIASSGNTSTNDVQASAAVDDIDNLPPIPDFS